MRAAVQIGSGDLDDIPEGLRLLADRAFFGKIAGRIGSWGNVVERDNASLTPAASRER